jgi:hypothetical protein
LLRQRVAPDGRPLCGCRVTLDRFGNENQGLSRFPPSAMVKIAENDADGDRQLIMDKNDFLLKAS